MINRIRHGSTFTGIGGFDLGSDWMGWETVFQVEKHPDARRVLKDKFPNVPKYETIEDFNKRYAIQYRGKIEVISGGFPCQPYSKSGKQKGESDSRNGWPEMFKTIKIIKPIVFVGENVPNLLNLQNGKTFDRICNDLETEGYKVECYLIPLVAYGATQNRERLFLIAYSDVLLKLWKDSKSIQSRKEKIPSLQADRQSGTQASNNGNRRGNLSRDERGSPVSSDRRNSGDSLKSVLSRWEDFSYSEGWESLPKPQLYGGLTRLSPQLDKRTKLVGNSVSPVQAYEIFQNVNQLFTQNT